MKSKLGSGIKIPDWAFKPDQWSEAFLRGLTKLVYRWENYKVWEVGVGSGINILTLYPKARVEWYFSDYDPRCVRLAIENLHSAGLNDRLNPLPGQWDLLTPPVTSKVPKVDVVFGCLPQVPSETNLSVGDRRAHYYNPDHYPKAHFNALGLGLIETLLVQAQKVLTPRGSVVLNLGGRPGRKRLLSLFKGTGYDPHVVHAETIEQHAGTSLVSLAELEKNGHEDFEFFTDQFCRELISAHRAEERRVKKRKVYHKIYVIAGTLT